MIGALSGRIMGAVQTQLEGLAERGEYLLNGEHILLREKYTDSRANEIQVYYKRCRDLPVLFSNEELDYKDLRQRIRAIAAHEHETYVDVTAIKKRYLGDIVAAAVVEGLGGLHVFDIVGPQPDYDEPWKLLIHELEKSAAHSFEYINIVDTEVYRSCARSIFLRTPSLLSSVVVTVILVAAFVSCYWFLGAQSKITQTMLVISSAASILSPVLGFIVPRGAK